jgi:integrase
MFKLRLDWDGKITWADVAEYPAVSLSMAKDIAMVAAKLLKKRACTAESLTFGLSKCRNALDLEIQFLNIELGLQKTREMPTFDDLYRTWYRMHKQSNRWPNLASKRRPIKLYEMHIEKHIGLLPVAKIRRSLIMRFMEPIFIKNPPLADYLLAYLSEVLSAAVADRLIDENPCPRKPRLSLKDHRRRVSKKLTYEKIPALMDWLETAALAKSMKVAMQMAVITAQKTNIIVAMEWQHFDPICGIWTLSDQKLDSQVHTCAALKRAFSSKLPDYLCTALNDLYEFRSNNTFVFSVDGKNPIRTDVMQQNFHKCDVVTGLDFGAILKSWCSHQTPPVDANLVARYVDHSRSGLAEYARRLDMYNQRMHLAELYCTFVMSSVGTEQQHKKIAKNPVHCE